MFGTGPTCIAFMPYDSRMPRFYFHFAIDSRLIIDDEGIELPSLDSARAEAVYSARQVASEAVKHGANLNFDAIVVVDDGGNEIMRVSAAQVLPKGLK
jgi:hypothetical protein